MEMKYAIEFTFNEDLRNDIYQYWEHLRQKGFATAQTVRRPYEPHISLLVFEDFEKDLIEKIESIDYGDFDKRVGFHSLGLFKHDYSVLFLNPRTEFSWRDVHGDHFNMLQDSCDNIWDFYYPSVWNPHCSLTMDQSFEKITDALKSLSHLELPLEGEISHINLVDFKEGITVHSRII